MSGPMNTLRELSEMQSRRILDRFPEAIRDIAAAVIDQYVDKMSNLAIYGIEDPNCMNVWHNCDMAWVDEYADIAGHSANDVLADIPFKATSEPLSYKSTTKIPDFNFTTKDHNRNR